MLDTCDGTCDKIHGLNYCKNYQNQLKCPYGKNCIYVHLTKTEEVLYKRQDKNIMRIALPEIKRTNNLRKICALNESGNCTKGQQCKFLHVMRKEILVTAQCGICYDNDLANTVITRNCKHVFCIDCIARLDNYFSRDFQTLVYLCPICRKENSYDNHIFIEGIISQFL